MNYERKIPVDLTCGVTIYDIMAGGKWKPYLINCMNRGLKRPSEFQRTIAGATKRWLGPVGYTLTSRVYSLIPIIRLMDEWGLAHAHLFDEMGQLKSAHSASIWPERVEASSNKLTHSKEG